MSHFCPQEQEQMRLERIRAQQEKDRQVAEALAKFTAMQTGLKSEKATEPRREGTENRSSDGIQSSNSKTNATQSSSNAMPQVNSKGSAPTVRKSAKVAVKKRRNGVIKNAGTS